jgi:TRAP-type C4-dicarboxylate transport system permease small subunit
VFRSKSKYRLDHFVAAISLLLMACIAFANVVSRYLFHFSFAATEEITINLFVWMTVAGMGIAFERGAHLGMVSLFNLLPGRFKRAIVVFSAALSALLFIAVDVYMIQAIHDELTVFHATSGAMGIPVWIYYAGVPVFSIFIFRGIYADAMAKLGAGGDKVEAKG